VRWDVITFVEVANMADAMQHMGWVLRFLALANIVDATQHKKEVSLLHNVNSSLGFKSLVWALVWACIG